VDATTWRTCVSLYRHMKSSEVVEVVEIEGLSGLSERLGRHRDASCSTKTCVGQKCPGKDGLGWTAGLVPLGSTRHNKNVKSLGLLALDFDSRPRARADALLGIFQDSGLVVQVHSTHRHKPEKCYFRAVFPLAREVKPSEFELLWQAVVGHFDILHDIDPSAKNVARLFFMPSCPHDGERFAHQFGAKLLNPDEFISEHVLASRTAERAKIALAVAAPPPPAENGQVDLKDLRRLLVYRNPQEDPFGEKAELLRRVKFGESLADKPGRKTVIFSGVALYGRNGCVYRAANLVAMQLPLQTTFEIVSELMRESLAKIPQYEDDDENEAIGLDWWLEVAKRGFDKTTSWRQEELQRHDRVTNQLRIRVQKNVRQSSGQPSQPALPLSSESDGEQEPEPRHDVTVGADDQHWRPTMLYQVDKTGNPKIVQVGSNVEIILENHPAFKGLLKWDEWARAPRYFGNALNTAKCTKTDSMMTEIEYFLQRNEGVKLSTLGIRQAIIHVALANKYDPLKEHLLSLTWDGIDRYSSFLAKRCGAIDRTGVPGFLELVGTRALLARIARALSPGCQNDAVLVLEGDEGIGKTSLVRALAGEWGSESCLSFADKDLKLLAASKWVIELAELSSLKKSEVELMKSFISTKVDTFRPLYHTDMGDFPRRCVFIGTTNDDEYLERGLNRRFWPVRCERIDVDAVHAEIHQINAEGVWRFINNQKWWFPKGETGLHTALKNNAADRVKPGSQHDEVIRSWFLEREPKYRPKEITILDIAVHALECRKDQVDQHGVPLGKALKRLGFVRRRSSAPGRPLVYRTPASLLDAPRTELSHGHLHLVSLGNGVADVDSPNAGVEESLNTEEERPTKH